MLPSAQEVLSVNQTGVMFTMRDAAVVMKRQGSCLIPLGRMADSEELPEELKGLVVLLASPASSFITGAAHVIDGGSLVQPSLLY